MSQEVYTIRNFDWKKTHDKLTKGVKRGIVLGDMSDEMLAHTKGVLSLNIKANGDTVAFQISRYGSLTISSTDNYKLKKARLNLRQLIGGEWIPKGTLGEEKPQIPYDARKSHTEQLKREVINPWMEQLPTISIKRVIFRISDFHHVFEKNRMLEVEGNDLFPDLKNHLHFKPDPFKRLALFKRKVREFREKREEMLAKIDKLVKKEIGLPVSGDWKPGDSNIVHRNLSEKILDAALEGDEKAFSMGLDFKSRMEPEEKVLEYRIGLRGYIRVSGERGEMENLRTKYDDKIKILIQKMKKAPYKVKAIEIAEVVQELERIKEEMKSVLTKHLNMPILPGDCDRLPFV